MAFDGRVAIVTGGAGGIGRATALRLAGHGACVAIADVRVDDAMAVAEEVRRVHGHDALGIGCDVGVEAEVASAVAQTLRQFGRLDVIVNNAALMVFKSIEDHTEGDLLRVLRVDFCAAFWFTQQAFRHCRPGAAIVNVASVHAVQTTPLVSSYAAAKAALLGFTRAAAVEGKSKGIRVNAVVPGATDTPMLLQNPNIASGVEALDPRDVGKPQDVAAAIVFLASDDAAFITGAALPVDGGRLVRL